MLIIHPVEKFLPRLLSNCSFYSLVTPFSSFSVTVRSAYAHLLLGFLFPFLCSLRGQCQQFCHPLASSAVSSRCDLYLNSLSVAHALSSSFTSLPWQFRLTKNHSCLFHGSSSLTKTEAGGGRKVLAYSYRLDTLKQLPSLGCSLP